MNRFLRPAVALVTFAAGASVAHVWDSGDGGGNQPEPATFMTYTPSMEKMPVVAAANSVEEQAIRDLYRRYDEAITAHDAAFFEQLETDTFIGTLGDGRTVTKAQAIAEMKTWDKSAVFRNDGLRIEVHGDAAIVTRRMTETYPAAAPDSNLQNEWADVLMKHDGRWRMLSTTQLY